MSLPKKYNVGIVQMSCTYEREPNIERAKELITEAADKGANVVCLPELFTSMYFCQREDASLFDLAEEVPGPTTQALAEWAKKHNVVVIAPVFEKKAPGIYFNSAAVIDADGSIVGFYRKMHIPDDPHYYEKYYFTPGDLGFHAFDTKFARIGVLICWDQWYPEGARLTALKGATTLFYPTAIGWHPAEKEQYGERQHSAWQTVMRGHAVANGVYVAAANRYGLEKLPGNTNEGIEFWGRSFVADPQGTIEAEAPISGDNVLIHTVDVELLEDIRRNWPFFRDRRIDAYTGITQRTLIKEFWEK